MTTNAQRPTQLGGGLELALQADILLAAPSAKLGQPEVNLGVIPGGGGTQRLARLIGRSRAMEMVLTGRILDAEEAERWGLVNRVVRDEDGVVEAAIKVAQDIAGKSRVAVAAGKEAVNAAFELSLAEGLRLERRLFHGLFATKDQKEGAWGHLLCVTTLILTSFRHGSFRGETPTAVDPFVIWIV